MAYEHEQYMHYTRKFLNDEKFESGAYILASIEDFVPPDTEDLEKEDEFGNIEPYEPYYESSVVIADCNRMVTLNFCIQDKETAQNSCSKLRTLIDTLQRFEKDLHKTANITRVQSRKKELYNKKFDKLTKEKDKNNKKSTE